MKRANFLVLAAVFVVAGCRHLGPAMIPQDRIAYNDAIATSWKEQTLLNIVRLRYGDMAEFVDVSSVVSGYELNRTTTGNFGADLRPHNFIANILSLGLSGSRSLSDRPTVTYSPQAGSEFNRNLITPIAPAMILSLIEGGTSADAVMDLAVESINGIRNRHLRDGRVFPEEVEFTRVLDAIKAAHFEGDLSFRFQPLPDREADKKKAPVAPIAFMTFQPDALVKDKKSVAIIRNELGLDKEKLEFKVVFGSLPKRQGKGKKNDDENHEAEVKLELKVNFGTLPKGKADEKAKGKVEEKAKEEEKGEIAIRTRSVLRVIAYLAEYVEVPASHLASERAKTLLGAGEDPDAPIRVYSGCKKPCDSFAAVQYQGHWFWIDWRDARSKRSLIYLRNFLTLADTGERIPGPLVTIRGN